MATVAIHLNHSPPHSLGSMVKGKSTGCSTEPDMLLLNALLTGMAPVFLDTLLQRSFYTYTHAVN